MSYFNGGHLNVFVGSTVVAYNTSANLNLNSQTDSIAPTSASAAAFENIEIARRGGSISCNGLYGTSANYDFKDIFDAWKAGTTLTITFKYDQAGEWMISGDCKVTSLGATGAINQLATARWTFTFTGEISIGTVA